MINLAFRVPLLVLSTAVLLSACGRQADSLGTLLTVSFQEKSVASLNVSLKCSYEWAYFSEQDMASHYNVKPAPAKAPTVFLTLPDRRMLALSPRPWPPVDDTGRCNLMKLKGWQALVFDSSKPIPLLTVASGFEETGDIAGLAIRPSRSNDGTAASAAQPAPPAFQQALEKASSLDFAVLEVPAAGGMSANLPAEIVAALWAMPTDRPSVLLPAKASNAPLNIENTGSDDTLAGLPGFHAAKVMDKNAYSTYPSAPGLPISVNPYAPGESPKAYFPGDIPAPSVTLPDLDTPVTIAPAAAVWYPGTRRLVVFTWTKRSGELSKLFN